MHENFVYCNYEDYELLIKLKPECENDISRELVYNTEHRIEKDTNLPILSRLKGS